MAEGGTSVDTHIDNALMNYKLWIGLQAKWMPYKTELDIANIIVSEVNKDAADDDKITTKCILSVQKIILHDPVWIIYCGDATTKHIILSCNMVEVEDRQYQLFDFQSESFSNQKKSSLRVSIHGIPFNVTDTEIEGWVDDWAKRKSKVMKAKVKPKHISDRGLLNGNRFCYVTEVTKEIPRHSVFSISDPSDPTVLVDIKITTYYEGQSINCWKCLQLDHTARECNSNNTNTRERRNENLEIFRGERNPLSNFYPVSLTSEEQNFSSSEQLYQYRKAVILNQPEDAQEILRTTKPLDIKAIGDRINEKVDTTKWEDVKVAEMRSVLELKFHTCKEFREKLKNSQDKILVEATNNLFWGSGLPPKATATQPCDAWPGSNRLGQVLMEMRTVKFCLSATQSLESAVACGRYNGGSKARSSPDRPGTVHLTNNCSWISRITAKS